MYIVFFCFVCTIFCQQKKVIILLLDLDLKKHYLYLLKKKNLHIADVKSNMFRLDLVILLTMKFFDCNILKYKTESYHANI